MANLSSIPIIQAGRVKTKSDLVVMGPYLRREPLTVMVGAPVSAT
jgi:hypothetical protein